MNLQKLNELKERLASNPRQVVVIFGAGVSMASAPDHKNVLNWVGLLKNGCEQCSDSDRRREIDALWADYDKCSPVGRGSLLIAIADTLVRFFDGQESERFANWIKGVFGQIEPDSNEEELIQTLMTMDVPLLTTNYDTIAETILDYPTVNIEERDKVERVIAGDDKGIIHLHGVWTHPKQIVLDWNSYQKAKSDYFLQFLQDHSSVGRNLLFVGFGGGMSDPNFSSWIERIFKIIPKSSYDKFMVATEEQSDIPNGIVPLYYGKKGEYPKLPAFLRTLMPEESSAKQMRRLPLSKPCFGRDTEIKYLVQYLTRNNGSRIVIYGPAGIGKGTTVVKALHKSAIRNCFKRIRSIPCNIVTTYANLYFKIAHQLDIEAKSDLSELKNAILSELKRAPTILLLDNFETLWKDENLEDLKDFLKQLAAVGELALLITYRGIPPSFGIKWTHECKLPKIAFPDDQKIFLKIAGQQFANDPNLQDLIDAMDGVPLAIELIAHLAIEEATLASLFDQWKERKTDLLHRGTTPDESWPVSLGLSLARLQPAEQILLSCIAFLPDGISQKYLEDKLPHDALSLEKLLHLGLVEKMENGWLEMLAPIREHINRHSDDSPDKSQLTDAMILYALENCSEIGSGERGREGLAAIRRIRPIIENIETSIRYGLKGTNWRRAATAAQKFAATITLACIGDPKILDEAYEKAVKEAKINPSQDHTILVANLRRAQAKIAETNGNIDNARIIYLDILENIVPILTGKERKRLEGRIKKDIADVILEKGEEDPTTFYIQAYHLLKDPEVGFSWHPIACELGQAAAILKQDIGILKGGGQQAIKAKVREANKKLICILEKLATFADLDLRRVKGKCYRLLSEAAEALRDDRTALRQLINALVNFGPTGDIKSCSNCILAIINRITESEQAERFFREYIENSKLNDADNNVRKTQFLTFGQLHINFAKEMENDSDSESILAAKFHYRAAKEFWKKANEPRLIHQAEEGLKRLALLQFFE